MPHRAEADQTASSHADAGTYHNYHLSHSGDFPMCPVCDICFSIYSSWTRHIAATHPSADLQLRFNCSACDQTFQSRRSVANHHTKTRGNSASMTRRSSGAGELVCEFCEASFPTKRSMGQNIRNQHAAEARARRAERVANEESRTWTLAEHRLFLEGQIHIWWRGCGEGVIHDEAAKNYALPAV